MAGLADHTWTFDELFDAVLGWELGGVVGWQAWLSDFNSDFATCSF
jgi:hypothetical protein